MCPRESEKPQVFVAGAGTSLDAKCIKETLHLDVEDVFSPDYTDTSVLMQRALGVTSEKVDLLEFHPEWVEKFDVVYDASFTDVFCSNWFAAENESTCRRRLTSSSRDALLNLLRYIKPNGMFVVKSNNQNAEEYEEYVKKATRGKVIYAPQIEWDASILGQKQKQYGGKTFVSRYGRESSARKLDTDGHVGFMRLSGTALELPPVTRRRFQAPIDSSAAATNAAAAAADTLNCCAQSLSGKRGRDGR